LSEQRRSLDLRIKGVKAKVDNRSLVITSDFPLKVLSSAVLNGGLTAARSIVNYHVPKSFKNLRPAAYLKRISSRLALPSPTVGLMTAVKMDSLSILREEDGKVVSMITAGTEPAAAAGDRAWLKGARLGTINIIFIIEGSLSDGAMVEVVKTATEAKSLALRRLDLRSKFSGEVASGTITDAVCVACTQRGKSWSYAGTGTEIGHAIGRAVLKGVEDSILKESGLEKNRSVIARLTERGIRFDDLLMTGMELFINSGTRSKEEVAAFFRKELTRTTSDPNVSSLLIAAIRLDEDGMAGALPRLTAEAFAADPVNLVADETIGMAIANYIAGTAGVHNFLYYDRMKPGITKTLGPFMDDAVCGLVAGVMSKVLREES